MLIKETKDELDLANEVKQGSMARMRERMADFGLPEDDDAISLAIAASAIAVRSLADVSVHGDTSNARTAAAMAILDRAYGKPGQSVTVTHGRAAMVAAWTAVDAEVIAPGMVEDGHTAGELGESVQPKGEQDARTVETNPQPKSEKAVSV